MRSDRASSTAILIGAATLLADREPDLSPLVLPGAAEWTSRMMAGDPRAHRLDVLLRGRSFRTAGRALERLLLPGLVRHFLLRKAWIEHARRRAESSAFNRLIVLGGGPFRSFRHEHRFEALDDATTRLTDVFTYAAPLGPLGRLAEAAFLTRAMRCLLQRHQQHLKAALESDEWRHFLPSESARPDSAPARRATRGS